MEDGPTSGDASATSRPALCLAVGPFAVIVAVVGTARLDHVTVTAVVRSALVVVWSAGAMTVGVRRRHEPAAAVMLSMAALGAFGILADAQLHPRFVVVIVALMAACALHLFASLPTGRPPGRPIVLTLAVAYTVALVIGLVAPRGSGGALGWPIVTLWVVASFVGLRIANGTYRSGAPVVRRRMQWVGWSLVVFIELVLVITATGMMADWPPRPATALLAATALLPLSLVAAAHDHMVARVDRLLTLTVGTAGLTALVIVAYGAVVVALGRTLRDGERSVLLLSMVAATLAALAYLPLRTRLADVANQVVYGERVAPDEALRTWGSRLTRSIPLDELLLQLSESLRKSMSLSSAEIFTGAAGVYELAASVPHRSAEPIRVPEKDCALLARAGVSGGTWIDVWLPALADPETIKRVAPIAHGGELLGQIVVTRPGGANAFSDDDDRVLTELARQVGLALHNVQLDSALQASLAELQLTNVELRESRLRIVTAGDSERRKLERNLHDGAQQYLVAMAVKLRIAEDLIEEQPKEAADVIVELRRDLKDAIAELRALAHGIFPPLLSSGGLSEALPAAATRAALPTTVDTSGVGRFGPEVESTVYFCCLEAMQNAAKHAGPDAEISVRVEQIEGAVRFEVRDDGVGFDVGPTAARGHGFANMTDRLGTIGGRLKVSSKPGTGTTVRGEIPLA